MDAAHAKSFMDARLPKLLAFLTSCVLVPITPQPRTCKYATHTQTPTHPWLCPENHSLVHHTACGASLYTLFLALSPKQARAKGPPLSCCPGVLQLLRRALNMTLTLKTSGNPARTKSWWPRPWRRCVLSVESTCAYVCAPLNVCMQVHV